MEKGEGIDALDAMSDGTAEEWAPQLLVLRSDVDKLFTYHPPKDGQPERYEAIRAKAKELAHLIYDNCQKNGDHQKAVDALRLAVMWANSAIANETSACTEHFAAGGKVRDREDLTR